MSLYKTTVEVEHERSWVDKLLVSSCLREREVNIKQPWPG